MSWLFARERVAKRVIGWVKATASTVKGRDPAIDIYFHPEFGCTLPYFRFERIDFIKRNYSNLTDGS